MGFEFTPHEGERRMSAPNYTTGPYGRKGTAVRLVFLAMAVLTWLITLGGRAMGRRTVVLCYHGVRPEQQRRFERQIRAIRGRAVPLEDLAASTHPRPVAVTFDDAFYCLHEHALPVLRQNDIPATVYAVSGVLGTVPTWAIAPEHPEASLRTMTPAELITCADTPGITIGSHTMTHPALTGVSPEQLVTELSESKQSLERVLGRPVVDLAYPHGAHSPAVDAAAVDAGYSRITTLGACAERPPAGPLIARFLMDPDAWPIEFKLTIDGAYAWRRFLRKALGRERASTTPAPQPTRQEAAA